LIDRLVHHSEIIAIEGDSYRMKEAQEQATKRRASNKGKSK
jgi:DNA replication protein DnaC